MKHMGLPKSSHCRAFILGFGAIQVWKWQACVCVCVCVTTCWKWTSCGLLNWKKLDRVSCSETLDKCSGEKSINLWNIRYMIYTNPNSNCTISSFSHPSNHLLKNILPNQVWLFLFLLFSIFCRVGNLMNVNWMIWWIVSKCSLDG